MPIRDFMAYDIGRYYLSAWAMSATGNHGILALRATWILVQGFGIGLGSLMVLQALKDTGRAMTLIASTALFLWMFPSFKVYDHAACIGLIAAVAFVLEKPTPSRYFLCGVAVGLAAIVGRNHGVNGAIGGVATIVYPACYVRSGPRLSAAFPIWTMGVLAGYLPMIIAIALVPGLAAISQGCA